MKQHAFEHQYAAEWDALERWLESRGTRITKATQEAAPFPDSELPQRYRRLCHQLALARDRRYATHVVERLHRLAAEIHQVLYGARSDQRGSWFVYAFGGFARNVRTEWRAVLAATLLFYLPFAAMFVVTRAAPDAVHYVMPASEVASFEEMYGPKSEKLGRREAGSDFQMFGHYIFNNVRIGFQMFAGGLLYGLGTLFFLLFNGVVLGAVSGYVVGVGFGTAFYSFVAGHSALELTGIVLAGAAGLKLGAALVAPGRLTRKQALIEAGRSAAGIMYGVAAMLLAAAFVEAFWSPRRSFAPEVKYTVGMAAWVLVFAYFAFAGRARAA